MASAGAESECVRCGSALPAGFGGGTVCGSCRLEQIEASSEAERRGATQTGPLRPSTSRAIVLAAVLVIGVTVGGLYWAGRGDPSAGCSVAHRAMGHC